MADLAKLQIAVDTTQVRAAVKDLDALQAATKNFSTSTAGSAQKTTSALNMVNGAFSTTARVANDNLGRAANSVRDFSTTTSAAMSSVNKSLSSVGTTASATGTTINRSVGGMLDSLSGRLDAFAGRVGNSLKPLTGLTSAFRAVNEAALSAFIAFQAVSIALSFGGKFIMAADQMQKTQIKLETLTGSSEKATETFDYLYKTAQKMSLPFEDLSKSYTKLLPLINSGVLSTKQGRDILEGLANTAAATGATTEQLNQSMYGLSQALTSPKVQAQELNQIIEPLPGLLQEMDAAAGLPAGGFRKLVNEGMITSKVLAEVLPAALDKYKDAAEKQQGLVGSSIIRLSNEWTKLKSNVGAPLQPVVAGFLTALTNILEFVNIIFSKIGVVSAAISGLLDRLDSPILKRILGVGAAAGAGAVVAGPAGALVGGGLAALGVSGGIIPESNSGAKNTVSKGTQDKLSQEYKALMGKGDDAGKSAKSKFNFPEYLTNLREEISLLKMNSRTADILSESMNVYNQAKKDGIILNQQDAQALGTLLKQKQQLTEIKDITTASNDNLLSADIEKLTEVERKQRDILRQGEAARLKELLPLAREAEKAGNLLGAYDAIQAKIEELSTLEVIAEPKINFDTALSASRNSLIKFSENDVEAFADSIDKSIVGAFSAAEDALIDFVRTGKANFGNFADSVINDIARIAIQQSVTKPLAGALSNVLGAAASAAFGSYFSGSSTVTATPGSSAGSQGQYTVGGAVQASSLPGYATGGEFQVGGSGGIDSQVVAFRATPGERVNISTPSQNARSGSERPSSGGEVVVQQSFNVDARGASIEAVSRLEKTVQTLSRSVKASAISAVRDAQQRNNM